MLGDSELILAKKSPKSNILRKIYDKKNFLPESTKNFLPESQKKLITTGNRCIITNSITNFQSDFDNEFSVSNEVFVS